MHIVFAASEAIPFAKTGGLADVCGTLPIKLAELGHRCSVFIPGYMRAKKLGFEIADTHVSFVVDMIGKPMTAHVLKATLPNVPVDFYLIDQPLYFERSDLYGDQHGDYRDNCERFAFFSKSVVHAIERMHLEVDIIHCHDWQVGLIPAFHKTNFGNLKWYQKAASVMTIHNLAYQGRFWAPDMPLTGMDWQYFNWQQMEFYGDLNMLKTGIVFADMITTVSPSYAREIQQPAMGCGLDGMLRSGANRLVGIVNGVDYDVWSPEKDSYLVSNYRVDDWKNGKGMCKADLQRTMGLPVREDVPMVGLVGRLAEQKGWDLVIPTIEDWAASRDVQWVVLGNGEQRFARRLSELATKHPESVAIRLEFSDALAHQIEAGCDIFLMPSRYEPCGLNQLYSLRYGSVPVVHATGGLNDTVVNVSDHSLSQGTATGFSFSQYEVDALKNCLSNAVDTYSRNPLLWDKLVRAGMNQDWSWQRSAGDYENVYRRAREMAAIDGRL